MPCFFRTEHAGGGKGGGRGQNWSEHEKKNCGTYAFNLASSTQRGEDGREERLVPPTSHSGLG